MSTDFNSSGGHYVKQASGKECKGCGRCYIVCPDCAIEVIND
jgi:ferredoxin